MKAVKPKSLFLKEPLDLNFFSNEFDEVIYCIKIVAWSEKYIQEITVSLTTYQMYLICSWLYEIVRSPYIDPIIRYKDQLGASGVTQVINIFEIFDKSISETEIKREIRKYIKGLKNFEKKDLEKFEIVSNKRSYSKEHVIMLTEYQVIFMAHWMHVAHEHYRLNEKNKREMKEILQIFARCVKSKELLREINKYLKGFKS